MADTFTTNLNLTKPEVGASTDTWGTKLNADLDTVDGLFSATGTSVAMNLDGAVIDSSVIGGTTPAAGTFTTLTANTLITGTLATAAQPNITSVGTLTGFTSTGIDDNADATAITIDSSENVGIGTTSPSQVLHVKDADYTRIQIEAGTTSHGAILNLGDSSDADYGSITQFASAAGEGGRMRFVAGAIETMNLRGGNVGIGDTSPATKLEVLDANGVGLRFGDIASTPSSQTAGYIGMSTSAYSGNNGDLVLIPRTSSASNILLMEGNVGIGTSSPGYPLDVAGNARANALVFRVDGSAPSGDASVFRPAAGTFAIATNSTEKVRVISNGNVGIGTTSPSYKLSLRDDSTSAYPLSLENINIGTAGVHTGIRFGYAGNTYQKGAIIFESQDANGRGKMYFAMEGTANSSNADETDAKMTIDYSGNVGIGTSSPEAKLHVADNTTIIGNGSSGYATINFHSATTGSARYASIRKNYDSPFDMRIRASNSSSEAPLIFETSSASEAMRIDSSGNVGIGVTPSKRLDVWDAGGGNIASFSNGANADLLINCTSGVTLLTPTTGTLAFGTSSTERMRIDSSGNLLVGTTSATTLATHSPNIITSTQLGVVSGSNKATFGVDRIYFDSSNYYVLNSSATGVKLVNGATAWSAQSDENLKENIVELTGALEKVKDYRCVEYNLIADETKSKKIGFIAQDWQKDYNQIIDKDDSGSLGIRYTETIPVLLKAIQEQQAQIEALQSEINELKNS